MTRPRCSVSSSGRPAAGSSSSTTRGLPTTARATSTRRRSRAPRMPTFASGSTSSPTNSIAPSTSSRARRGRAWSARGRARRCRRPRAPRSPARSGRCAAGPSARAGSRHGEQVVAEGVHRARGRAHEAAQHVEERRLAGAVGADQPARAAGELDGHAVDRRHAAEAHREVLDLDHSRPPSAAGAAEQPPDQPPELRHVARELVRRAPAARSSSTCRTPTPKRIVSRSAGRPQLSSSAGRSLHEQAGDDRAPEAVDRRPSARRRAAVIESLCRELVRVELAHLGRQQAARDARQERRERERPQLVERDVHAGGERRRLALADRRPRAPGPARARATARAGT